MDEYQAQTVGHLKRHPWVSQAAGKLRRDGVGKALVREELKFSVEPVM